MQTTQSTGRRHDHDRRDDATGLYNKVPVVTLIFWIIKILSTTVGETGADYLAVHVGLGPLVTACVMSAFLLLALGMQLRSPRYIPWLYWLTVVLVSVVGTQITDGLTDGAGVSLFVSTPVFAVLLAVHFLIWYTCEKTLSIRTIVTRRREVFYWIAVLLAFAFGTAAGDLVTEALGLGFRLGIVVIGALILLVALAARLHANTVLAFWIAYILTRPFGASLGDYLAQATQYGGLGMGTVYTSLVFLAAIVMMVVYISLPARR